MAFDAAPDRLLAWKSDQYRRTGWINVFDRLWIVDLIEYLFSTHSDPFGGLLSLLRAGGTPVAAHFGLRSGPMLAHCYPAYDRRFGKQSPGLIHRLRLIEETAGLGVQLIDMGKGPERYKQTLKSRDLFVAEGMVTQGVLLAAVHQARAGAVRWAGPRIRHHPSLFHAADRLLRHYGRLPGCLCGATPAAGTATAMATHHPGCGRHISVETLLKQQACIRVFHPEGQLCVTEL